MTGTGRQIWDIAGGALLVREAGGIVSDLQGSNAYLNNGHIVAAPNGVHQDLLEITSRNYPF